MHVAAPQRIFSRDLDLLVLLELVRTDVPISGRQVAERVERSEAGVREALDRLVRQGVVRRMKIGTAYGHTLNRGHVATPIVEAIAAMRREVIQSAHDVVERWEIQPLHASFFGSFARRDGDEDSDLDILLVHPAGLEDDEEVFERWKQQTDELHGLHERTGNSVQILDLADATLQDPDAEAAATLASIVADEISLTDTRLGTLLRRHRGSARARRTR